MGTVVIAGMLAATLVAIFIIPASFYVVEKLAGAVKKVRPQTAPDAPSLPIGD